MIGESAFSAHANICEIILPDTVHTIEESAFAACDRLAHVALGKGLQTIEADAFTKLPLLQRLELPDSLRYLSERAITSTFGWDAKHKGLTDIRISPNHPLFFVEKNGLYEKLPDGGVKLVKYLGDERNVVVREDVTVIGECAFHRSGIVEITLPAGIRSVHKDAFLECPLDTVMKKDSHAVLRIPAQPSYIRAEALTGFYELPDGQLYDFTGYDRLAEEMKLCAEKIKMICCRLQYPIRLDERTKQQWIDYLRHHLPEVVELLAQKEDLASIESLIGLRYFTEQTIDTAIEIVNRLGKNDLLGVLMNYKHEAFGHEEFDFSL
jgi:hypothetical protein